MSPAGVPPEPSVPDVLALIASVLQLDPADLAEEDGTDTVPAWDSLRIMLLASLLEFSYDITLDSSEVERLTTVRAVREIVARHAGP